MGELFDNTILEICNLKNLCASKWLGSCLEQAEIKGAGLAFDAFGPDLTVMGLGDRLADGQT